MNTYLLKTEAKRPQRGLMYYSTQAGKFCCILSFMLISLAAYSQDRPFITIWKTDNAGETEDNQVKFPGHGTDYTIDWEKVDDEEINGSETATNTHIITFPEAGTYRLSVSGSFHRISFTRSWWNVGDSQKLIEIEQWGDVEWSSMFEAFQGCGNMVSSAVDVPDLSNVTDMSSMFNSAYLFNSPIEHWNVSNVRSMRFMFSGTYLFDQSLNNWDVSNVTDMSGMFFYSNFNNLIDNWDVSNVTNMNRMFSYTNFNNSLDNWDVSKVIDMSEMFRNTESFDNSLNSWNVGNVITMQEMFWNATSFNQDISNWDVSNVTNMKGMFSNASSFNKSIEKWDVSNVIDMTSMFADAKIFNQPLNNWDVSNVKYMGGLFSRAFSFNKPLDNWDVSNVVEMRYLFFEAKSFNQDISKWDVSKVKDMSNMFYQAYDFNQPLNNWNVSNVEFMYAMFAYTEKFNQPLDNWDVSKASYLSSMFRFAKSFNQSLGNWNISSASSMTSMFSSSLSFHNYDLTIKGWASLESIPYNVDFGAQVPYCMSKNERQRLIEEYGWSIRDGGQDCEFGTFITVWDSNADNSENRFEINIPFKSEGTYVYWKKHGTNEDYKYKIFHDDSILIEVDWAGEYQINILSETGSFISTFDNNMLKLKEIKQWGSTKWENLENAFSNAQNLLITANDIPDLSRITNLTAMFKGAKMLEIGLSNWDVSKVQIMDSLFYGAHSFNDNIKYWNVSKVLSMSNMFNEATSFNHDISNWDVSNVQNMDRMFYRTDSFNRNIGSWDVSKVTRMTSMFQNAVSFNQPLASWDVSHVETMSSIFSGATSFNQSLEDWDVSQVIDMDAMFKAASSFDQSLGDWDIASVENMFSMLDGTNLSIENYDASLTGWAASATTPANIVLGAEGLFFCESFEDRQKLVDELGWNIMGDKRCLYTVTFYPEEGATLVAFDTDLVISFNQPIEAKDFSLISMEDFEGNSIAITDPQIDDNSIVFKAESELSHHSYRVHLAASTVVSEDGVSNDNIIWEFSTQRVLSNELELQTQKHYNVPNPFRDQTQIYFSLSSPKEVVLLITDLQGRLVEQTDLGMLAEGEQSYTFQATALFSGLYTYHIITSNERLSGKMVVK